MSDRLSGHLAAVDPEVHSVEAQFPNESAVQFSGQGQHLPLFIRRQVEEVWLVATRHNQHVTRTDRVGIRKRQCQRSTGRDVFLLDPMTERAVIRFHWARLRPSQSSAPSSWAKMIPCHEMMG